MPKWGPPEFGVMPCLANTQRVCTLVQELLHGLLRQCKRQCKRHFNQLSMRCNLFSTRTSVSFYPPYFCPVFTLLSESRGIARIINSNVCQHNDLIQELVDNHGAVPAMLPAGLTLGMLKALPSATVNAVLAAYDQVPVGDLAARRCQLGVWFGLKRGFF
ncbi:hypothetical protein, variant [Aphanomyces astaci]|uniref:Uncharacterized protein n=1 Tax=Aphanomyces astaci TaxID=112090 RepID=W4F8Y4_APHAT|nr:hypothetical protein H257_19125 [Aphanomyces astaci]XP_009846575.1 hypothetical protein, variant [Aphanomyces astaci]ETV63945.1 hypothetical protein H257_19125 [Aphanomyces astaci]ETV63946.1 hypothetical protein, variant [Aphanomyces astaci]|eukprot:XP_009846574.1 hypothetical protein H257_19125 [Aphanomyces astaci]